MYGADGIYYMIPVLYHYVPVTGGDIFDTVSPHATVRTAPVMILIETISYGGAI